MATFNGRLRQLMKEKGFTQHKLQKRLMYLSQVFTLTIMDSLHQDWMFLLQSQKSLMLQRTIY